MSTPLATPTELGTYLGETIAPADARATLILQLAHDLCESVVAPVPTLAKGVELAIAGRAWTNVTSARQASLGSASISFGASFGGENSSVAVGGLYLSRSEKSTLRRLAGRAGAFTINLLQGKAPALVPAVAAAYPAGATTGDVLTLSGYGFATTETVTVGGTSATFEVIDDSMLRVTLPAGVAGVVDIVITNDEGDSQPFSYTRA